MKKRAIFNLIVNPRVPIKSNKPKPNLVLLATNKIENVGEDKDKSTTNNVFELKNKVVDYPTVKGLTVLFNGVTSNESKIQIVNCDNVLSVMIFTPEDFFFAGGWENVESYPMSEENKRKAFKTVGRLLIEIDQATLNFNEPDFTLRTS